MMRRPSRAGVPHILPEDEQKRMAPGKEEKALAAASPSAKAAESIIAPAVGGSAGGLGDGLVGGISASKFIAVHGNAGPKANFFLCLLKRAQRTVMTMIQEALHHAWTMKW